MAENKQARLKSILVKNFGPISSIEIHIKGEVTRLIGMNGSGKTTLTHKAFAAAFRGIAEKGNKGELIGSRFRFIGPNAKTANVEITIEDIKAKAIIKVENKISPAGNSLQLTLVEGPENYILDRDWIYSLFNESLISARKFASLSPRDQALALGINTSKYDENIKTVKEERKLLKRDLANAGTVLKPSNIQMTKVSLKDLLDEKKSIEEKNKQADLVYKEFDRLQLEFSTKNKLIEDIKKQLEYETKELVYLAKMITEIKLPQKIDITEIDYKIEQSETINTKVFEYEKAIEAYNEYEKLVKKVELKENEVQLADDKRTEFINNFKMPFKDLTVDDNNGLLLKGRPINYDHYSSGEMEKIVALIGVAINPDLKLRFIDDFNLLDEKNQHEIVSYLINKGFQVIINDIGDKIIDQNSILIQDGNLIAE